MFDFIDPDDGPITGSVDPASIPLNYDTTGDDRHMATLYRKVEALESKLHLLETKKIIDECQFPQEVLESNGLLPQRPKKTKRGKGYRPILQGEIEEAKKHAMSAMAQARWLGVHLTTYRKYAKMYGIYDPKPNQKGRHRKFDPTRGKYPLVKILQGEYNGNPSISEWMVKRKLIMSGTVLPKCNICGYDKRRVGDNKICLLLDHKDGNLENFKGDNLQLLCLNCTFECGRGYIRRGKHLFDPDWMQGAEKNQIDVRPTW